MRRIAILACTLAAVSASASPALGGPHVHAGRALTAHRAYALKKYRACRTGHHPRCAAHWRDRFRYWRNEQVWAQRYARLSPLMKARLAHLRHCETRGLKFPHNYRYTGAHDGAYQYLVSTWHRAGGRGRASSATPHEQDVRTARFWPSHYGEWSCKA